jgi:hypothetical protein
MTTQIEQWKTIAAANSSALNELSACEFFVQACQDVDVSDAGEVGMPRIGSNKTERVPVLPNYYYSSGQLRAGGADLQTPDDLALGA